MRRLTVAMMKGPSRLIAFKRVFIPLLVLAFLSQLALAWSQRQYLAAGYFDFVLYYSGARIIHEGRRQELFNIEVQRYYQKDFGVALLNLDVPFNHPPYELLIFLPLVYFSYPIAHGIWSSLNALLLLLTVRRLAPFIDRKHDSLYVLMAFAYFPCVMAVKMGHDSVLSTFLLVEAFRSLKCRRDATAGSLLALGLYKPQLVLPMIGVLGLSRHWRLVAAFALTGVVLAGISLAMVGGPGAVELWSIWLTMGDRGHIIWPEHMTNLRGWFYVMLDTAGLSAATNALTIVASAALYGCTMFLWRGRLIVPEDLFDVKFSLAIVTTVLISFHLYSYDASLLLLPLIVMLNQVLSEKTHDPVARHIFLLILIAIYIPLLPNFLLSRSLLAWGTVPILLLYVVMAMEIRKRVSAPPASASTPGKISA